MKNNNIKCDMIAFNVDIRKFSERVETIRREVIRNNPRQAGLYIVRWLSDNMDMIFDDLFNEMFKFLQPEMRKIVKSELSVIALGGYGRGELNLFSDIDLLFLVKENVSEITINFIRKAVSFIWDLKLEVGHSVRTISECLDCIGSDIKSAISLSKIRLLWGNKKLLKELERIFNQRIQKEGINWLVQERLDMIKQRHSKYGESVYLMEPNIKEGEGGLRDIEFIRWVTLILKGTTRIKDIERRYIFKMDESILLERALNFLFCVRNEIHSSEKRRSDVLSYEKQILIAKRLKYRKTKHFLPEERLMYDYYSYAKFVHQLCKRSTSFLENNFKYIYSGRIEKPSRIKISPYFQIVEGTLQFIREKYSQLSKNPTLILELFLLSAKYKTPISEGTKKLISDNLHLINQSYRRKSIHRDIFFEIFKTLPGLSIALQEMHEAGFLNHFIPEFKRITSLVRIDFYHRYTTDEHSFFAVREFEALFDERLGDGKKDNEVVNVAREIKRPELLAFAILMHDIGKGEGHGHILRGAQIVQRITSRLGLQPNDQEIIRKLVLYHLRMAHISQRRNLDDPDVIKSLADEIQDYELLKMLYLLTYSDIRAIAPDVWNDWKGQLLFELYRKTSLLLKGKTIEETMAYSLPENLDKEIKFFLQKDGKSVRTPDIANFINSAPLRYLASTSSQKLAHHFLMLKSLNLSNRVVWEISKPEGTNYSEITVYGFDEPGFFCKVCASLSSKDLNILSAQIYSTKDGFCIDIFQVTNLDGEPIPVDYSLERTRLTLNAILKNEMSIEALTEKYSRGFRKSLAPDRSHLIPTKILIDNNSSHTHTIVEVKTLDRPWLLYTITKTLSQENLNIDLALISTEAYRVVDVFYITDLENNKIMDPICLSQIEEKLMLALKTLWDKS